MGEVVPISGKIKIPQHGIIKRSNKGGAIIVIIDPNERIKLINNKGSSFLGYCNKELINKNWFDLVIPERIREELRKLFQQLIRGEIKLNEYIENPIISKTGERIVGWHNSIMRDQSGQISGVLCFGLEVMPKFLNVACEKCTVCKDLLFDVGNYVSNAIKKLPPQ